MPVDDVFAQGGTVGPNGRMFHDMYLMEVKKPDDSKGEWDYYNVLATVPGQGGLHRPRQERLPARTSERGAAARVAAPGPGAATRRCSSARGLRKEFAGFVAVKDVDIDVHRRPDQGADRPERRRQDHRLQPADQVPPADRRHHHPARPGHHRPRPGPRRAHGARRAPSRSRRSSRTSPSSTTSASPCSARTASPTSSGAASRALDALTPRAHALLEAVGLRDHAPRPAADLSYGRKRVLEIATTLALDPRVLLLDEPMAGMGHEDVGHVAALISPPRRGPRRPDGRAQSLASSPTSATRSSSSSAARSSPQGDYATVSRNPQVREAYMGTADA